MFGSNFPIEKLWTGYAGLIGAYRSAVARRPFADQKAILATAAARVYRIDIARAHPA